MWLRLTQETIDRLRELLEGSNKLKSHNGNGQVVPLSVHRLRETLLDDRAKQVKASANMNPNTRKSLITYILSSSKEDKAEEEIRSKTVEELWDLLNDES